MIFKKLLWTIFFFVIGFFIFFLFFWDVPAPTKKIEKKLDVNRLKNDE